MYTLNRLQKDLEKARENLREVEDHIQKVDGKPFTGPGRFAKSDNRSRFSELSKDEADSVSPAGRKKFSSLDPRRDLRENLKYSAKGDKFRVPNDEDDLEIKRPRLADDDLLYSLKRYRERREQIHVDVGNFDRRSDEERSARTVFSRLSGPDRREYSYQDDEDEPIERKPAVLSRVCPAEEPSRADVLAAQRNTDEKSKQRNKRMFGALVGTLQQFRRDETRTKDREAARQRIDAKLEEEQRKEREKLQQEKRDLLAERKRREVEIKRIEWSLNRVKEFAAWEASVTHLQNFICTQTKPHIYYLPKRHTPATEQLLENTCKTVREMIDIRLKNLNEEIENSEKKAQRNVGGDGDPANGVDKENLGEDEEEMHDHDVEVAKTTSNSGEPKKHEQLDEEEVQEGEWEEADKQQIWQEDGDNAVDITQPESATLEVTEDDKNTTNSDKQVDDQKSNLEDGNDGNELNSKKNDGPSPRPSSTSPSSSNSAFD